MKRTLAAAVFLLAAGMIFAVDVDNFKVTPDVTSYTKIGYSVTSKFGDYFRTITEKHVHNFTNGFETEVISYNAKDELTDKTYYKYDASNNLSCTVITDDSETTLSRSDFEYHNDGKLRSESCYSMNGNLSSKIIYKYDGNVVTESNYNEEGQLLARSITSVNPSSRPVETAYYDGNGILAEKTKFTYTEGGKVSSIEYIDDKGLLSEKEIYRYDSSNFLTEILIYNAKNVLYKRVIYKNDAKGNPIRISFYDVAEKFGSTANDLTKILEYSYF